MAMGKRTSAAVRNGTMQIEVLVVPTDRPDALQGFLLPHLPGQFVLDSERLDGKTAIVHRTDKVERNRRGYLSTHMARDTPKIEPKKNKIIIIFNDNVDWIHLIIIKHERIIVVNEWMKIMTTYR